MTTWADAPKIQGPPQTNDISVLLGYVKKLADVTAKMAKDLEFILNGNVAFDNIRANGIETKNLKAGSVIAEKIDVDKLSAISADLGHIRAGLIEAVEIYGSYIATSDGDFPYCAMSSTDNAFGAYFNEGNYLMMLPDQDGLPALVFFSGGSLAGYLDTKYGFNLTSTSNAAINAIRGRIEMNAGGSIVMDPTGDVSIPSWDRLFSRRDSKTLQEVLDDIYSKLNK